MSSSKNEKSNIFDFINKITGWDKYEGGYLEVVIDYRTSRYFNHEQVDEIIEFSEKMAKSGCEVHFGPALREKDLGNQRSDINNIFSSKCLWVDIDAPDKTLPVEQQIEDVKKLVKDSQDILNKYNVKPSYEIQSGHGVHVYFVLRRVHYPPGDNWSRIQNALIVLANGDRQAKDATRLLRVPGTFNYKYPEEPKEVKIIHAAGDLYLEDKFKEIVKDFGIKATGANLTPSDVKPLGFTPPCIEHLLDPINKPPMGYRHQVRVNLGIFAFHEGWDLDATIQKVMHTGDDPKKAERDIRGVYSTLDRDPSRYTVGCNDGSSLRALVDAGITVCDEQNCEFKKPKEAEDDDKKGIPSAWFDRLVDIVLDDDGKLAFLVKDDEHLIIKDKHETPDGLLVPPPKESIIWEIPTGSAAINHYTSDNDNQLFNDLVEYHKSISELPSEDHYKYLAAWDMHTYLFDNGEYSPVNWLYAIPERGKSRTGKGCIYVAWRGIHVITLKEAHIIRLATDQRATIFFDIMDLWKRVAKADAEDIMLNRYERGARVSRVLYPEKGAFKDTVYYDVYGPTIVATNETIDEIMQTRAIQIIMPESNHNFDDDVKPRIGLPFRERLVAFRARWMDQPLPAVDKPIKGRLGDILRPIRQIVNITCSDETWFLDFAKTIEEMRKKEGLDTFEAQVLSAIIQAERKVENGRLLHQDIRNILNNDRPERFHISPQKLGRVTAQLGFPKYTSGDLRGIYWDEELINRLCERYGIKRESRDNGILTI